MLSHAENEMLCRVGPGTPMGELFRRYWIPALASEDLPHPDCDPVRLPLLGENFVAFRDSEGRVGVLDEMCCHRGASLALGRVENCGITCIYHGWRYAVDGTILETPNYRDSGFKDKLKAPAYPVQEVDGIIWAYFGPPEKEPPLPVFPFSGVPEDERVTVYVTADINWVQLLENSQDPSHLGILHANDTFAAPLEGVEEHEFVQQNATAFARAAKDLSPDFEVLDTDFGLYYAGSWNASPESRFVRVFSYLMPFTVIFPGTGITAFKVPIDDYTTRAMAVFMEPGGVLDRDKLLHQQYAGNERDFVTKYGRSAANLGHIVMTPENGWLQDRATLGTSWTGLEGIAMQDQAALSSMGAINDRTREHLVPADVVVIRTRRRLLKAARELQEGKEPPVLDPAVTEKITWPAGELPLDVPWQSLLSDAEIPVA